jgi:hypothetical protein
MKQYKYKTHIPIIKAIRFNGTNVGEIKDWVESLSEDWTVSYCLRSENYPISYVATLRDKIDSSAILINQGDYIVCKQYQHEKPYFDAIEPSCFEMNYEEEPPE